MGTLEEQFLEYQVADLKEVVYKRVDEAWAEISKQKDFNGQTKLDFLANTMLGILTIFHANADCERIFSVVRKNKTETRPNIGITALNAILTRKVYMGACNLTAHSKVSDSVLRKAKSLPPTN